MARVLIIEDRPAIAMILQEALADEGYDTATAPNGNAGLERLLEKPAPDIALVDLFMPGVDGRTVIETLRSDPRYPAIPAVIITGAEPTPEAFPPEGTYQAVIRKPFDLDVVLSTVKRLLQA